MPKAIIIGGSLGGLLVGNLLRSIGWEAEVYERVGDDLAVRGAGIGTHEELLEVMRRIGVEVDASIGIHPESRTCYGLDGRGQHRAPRPRILSSWGRLYRSFKDAFPESSYHFDKSLASFVDDGQRIVARFTDGSIAEGDLLIGADGIRSTVRGQLIPQAEPEYAGYIAWRGLIPEADIPADLHREIFDHNMVCYPDGEAMTAYAVPGPDNDVRPGHRAYNFVWYHPTTRDDLTRLCTDASGRCHGMAIPPSLIRPEAIAEMLSTARTALAPQCVTILEIAKQQFFQAIFDLETPRMYRGRAALLGDAAFVARPHVGMGVTKAALDAECLADALRDLDGIEAALERYHARQHLFGTRVIARARYVGAHLGARATKPPETWTEQERHQDPVFMIRESGARLRDVPELIELVRRHRGAPQ